MQPPETLDRSVLEQRYRRSRTGNLALVVALVISLIALAIVAFGSDAGTSAADTADSDATSAETGSATASSCPIADRRDPDDPMAVGDIDAPVVLHEWTDFRCPYCGLFSRDTMPELISEYVDTGQVRIEFHDAALVGGENSVQIAGAARAAGDQGRYLEYLTAVYERQEASDNAELSVDDMVDLGATAGVGDLTRLRSDIESGVHLDAVRASTSDAQSFGVSGVPFFATTDCTEVLSGAQPVDTFRTALDQSLDAMR